MARGLKLTGFARFFIMLVIMAPMAYLIASYANGQDGVANLKKLLGIAQNAVPGQAGGGSDSVFISKKEKIHLLELEVAALKDSLQQRDLEISRLKGRLEQ